MLTAPSESRVSCVTTQSRGASNVVQSGSAYPSVTAPRANAVCSPPFQTPAGVGLRRFGGHEKIPRKSMDDIGHELPRRLTT